MMGWGRFLLALCVAASFLFSADVEAAKKKKAEPMTIIKASDTQYNHAKLVRSKKVKKKKFLWFKKKKKAKTIAPVQARVNMQPIVPAVASPSVLAPASDQLDTSVGELRKGSENELQLSKEKLVEDKAALLPEETESEVVKPKAAKE